MEYKYKLTPVFTITYWVDNYYFKFSYAYLIQNSNG